MNSLSRVRQFILQERDLFGDTLVIDASLPNTFDKEIEVRSTKHAATKSGSPVKMPATVAQSPKSSGADPWEQASSLDELESMIKNCHQCGLWETRTNLVFGTGNPRATFMVVGEAPGADEDAQGKPFVGRAGQLLTKILEAIGFKREDVYIANVLKSRPPNNRKPLPEEVEVCLPYLKKQISLIKPKVILCLGLTAAENLLKTGEPMAQLRGGRVFQYEGTPLMVTYHPAALLRNPGWKRPVWEDVQAARKLHDDLLHREGSGVASQS